MGLPGEGERRGMRVGRLRVATSAFSDEAKPRATLLVLADATWGPDSWEFELVSDDVTGASRGAFDRGAQEFSRQDAATIAIDRGCTVAHLGLAVARGALQVEDTALSSVDSGVSRSLVGRSAVELPSTPARLPRSAWRRREPLGAACTASFRSLRSLAEHDRARASAARAAEMLWATIVKGTGSRAI